MNSNNREVLSTAQAAYYIGVTPPTLRKFVQQGKIAIAFVTGNEAPKSKSFYFYKDELDKYKTDASVTAGKSHDR